MKTRGILHLALLFLAVNIGIGSYIVAASTFQLTQTSQDISGTDSESGVAFQASLPASDHVVIDAYLGTKRIHADIDYTRRTVRVRTVSQANGTPVALSVQDIVAFQKLRVSLPPKIDTASLHGDALTSLINLMASAPAGHAIDIAGGFFTSICPEIGGPGVATYTLGTFFTRKTYHTPVTVGPLCYIPPALGRCGAGGGQPPDPLIGSVQRFTQQCLNHDQCCVATRDRLFGKLNVCGNSGFECVPEFVAAAPGFFLAPDCGKTAGDWTDNYGYTYVLSGGNSNGDARPFTGTVNVTSPPCGTWQVTGTRTGTGIVFTATNPSSVSATCAASYTYTGTYSQLLGIKTSNGCNSAMGTWTNSSGIGGTWFWNRTNAVSQTVLMSSTNAGPRPADK